MKIYVEITQDHHSDLGIMVFTDRNEAIQHAVHRANEFAGYNDSTVEHSSFPGCPYHGFYSAENDSVAVYEREVEV